MFRRSVYGLVHILLFNNVRTVEVLHRHLPRRRRDQRLLASSIAIARRSTARLSCTRTMNSSSNKYKQELVYHLLLKKELLNLHNMNYKGNDTKYLQSAGESVVKLVLADHNSHSL